MFRCFLTILILIEFLTLSTVSIMTKPRREPDVRGGYTKCMVHEYNYIEGKLDTVSGKKIRQYAYNEYGL